MGRLDFLKRLFPKWGETDPRQDALNFIKKYDGHVLHYVIESDITTGETNTHILVELRIPHKEEKQESSKPL